MNLQEEWKRCWRWLSVHLAALAMFAPDIYANSDILQHFLTDQQFHIAQKVLGALVLWSIVRKKKS